MIKEDIILTQSCYNSILKYGTIANRKGESIIDFIIHADIHTIKQSPNEVVWLVIPFFDGKDPIYLKIFFNTQDEKEMKIFKEASPLMKIAVSTNIIFSENCHIRGFRFKELIGISTNIVHRVQYCRNYHTFQLIPNDVHHVLCCSDPDIEILNGPLKKER